MLLVLFIMGLQEHWPSLLTCAHQHAYINVVFPSLAGKGLKLSPTIMFLSLLYWGYVLGVSGALVAIPLTIVVKIMLVSFKETKWIARFVGLLGD
jgi:predicted PurR-regulated permease PerM